MNPMSPNLPQDRAAIVPPRIQQEMAKHMEQTLPANLKYYQQSGAYVPPNVQKQIAQHMEQTMPNHLKEYINPYMQQTVVPQHLAPIPGGVQPTQFSPTNPMVTSQGFNQPSHSFEVHPEAQPQQALSSQVGNNNPQAAGQPPANNPHQELYEFITNPTTTEKSPSLLPSVLSGKSLRTRIAILGGGLVALLIILNVLKGLLSTSFPLTPFLSILQDQQELIHISMESAQSQTGQAALPSTYQNFLATTQLTVTSVQTQLLTYLTNNNQKISPKQLDLKLSPAIDAQLNNAAAAGNFTSTFQQIMTSQLNSYTTDVRAAYTQTSGEKGHAQLRSEYSQAKLLIKQLDQADGTPVD